MTAKKCPVCDKSYATWNKVLTHVTGYHAGQPVNITCNIDGCQHTFKNTANWRRHAYRFAQHRVTLGLAKQVISGGSTSVELVLDESEDNDDAQMDATHEQPDNLSPINQYSQLHSLFQNRFLSLTMQVREELLLPQSSVTKVVDGIEGLFELYSSNIKDIIKRQLTNDPDIDKLDFMLEDDHFFSSICSIVRNDKGTAASLAMHLPHVRPHEIALNRDDPGKKDFIHIVPLIQSLKTILSNDDIVDEILAYKNQLEGQQATDKLHDLILNIGTTDYIDVPLIFYIDEFEPCNPIGSRKKIHKISGTYFTMACLPPRLRARLKSIFLYCLAYCSRVKTHGYGEIFKFLIDDLIELANSDITVRTKKGREFSYRVRLQMFCADNLAAHDIMGLQTHFNHGKVSRYCYVDYKEIGVKYDCANCPLRMKRDYEEQIALIDIEPTMSNYGIKSKCVFNEVPYLNPIELCPPDVMHDFLEGVVPIVICLALSSLMKKLKISLIDMNSAIQSFKYGKADKTNKYGPYLSAANLKKLNIPGTATEKFCLLRMLPLMVKIKFTDQIDKKLRGMKLLRLCLEVSDIIMAPVICKEWLADLHRLIIDLHILVRRTHLSAIKPKFHFLSHYPQLIARYGPPRHYFTMRFESVHQYFKRLTSRTRNFINLTQTLSNRYQNLKAFYLGHDNFFSDSNNITGSSVLLSSLGLNIVTQFRAKYPFCANEAFITNIMELQGVKYSKGYAYVIDLLHDEAETPHFFEIETIVRVNSEWFGLGRTWETLGFNETLHAYEVTPHHGQRLMLLGTEQDHSPLSVYTIQGTSYITMKYCVTKHVSCKRFDLFVDIMSGADQVFQLWNEAETVKKAVKAASYEQLKEKGIYLLLL